MPKTSIYPGIVLILLLSLSGCKKNRPGDQLPPLTNTGAETFGCRIDGQVFTPKKIGLTYSKRAYYQQIFTGPSGKVFLAEANHFNSSCDFQGVTIEGDSIRIEPNGIYPLKTTGHGRFTGQYVINYDCNVIEPGMYTNDIDSGQLHITHLDTVNFIVSGTFWFNVTDRFGTKHQITDGRFDLHYNP